MARGILGRGRLTDADLRDRDVRGREDQRVVPGLLRLEREQGRPPCLHRPRNPEADQLRRPPSDRRRRGGGPAGPPGSRGGPGRSRAARRRPPARSRYGGGEASAGPCSGLRLALALALLGRMAGAWCGTDPLTPGASIVCSLPRKTNAVTIPSPNRRPRTMPMTRSRAFMSPSPYDRRMLPNRADIAAPPFPPRTTWVGAEPPAMERLTARGPVLVHFIEFAQLNSVRALPYTIALDDRYRDAGLTVLGVHSPRFPFTAEAAALAHGAGAARREASRRGRPRLRHLARLRLRGVAIALPLGARGRSALVPLRGGRLRGDRAGDSGRAPLDQRRRLAARAAPAHPALRRARAPWSSHRPRRSFPAARPRGRGVRAPPSRPWSSTTRPEAPP